MHFVKCNRECMSADQDWAVARI